MANNPKGLDLTKEIRFLLHNLDDWLPIARRSRLLDLPQVTDRIGSELADTRENRALILQQLVDEIIGDGLSAAQGSPRRSGMWEAMHLLFVEDLDQDEVAKRLGVSVSTVKRYVREGIGRLCREFIRSRRSATRP